MWGIAIADESPAVAHNGADLFASFETGRRHRSLLVLPTNDFDRAS
jgi:hypothetical protein